jgi:hypothetical protein
MLDRNITIKILPEAFLRGERRATGLGPAK